MSLTVAWKSGPEHRFPRLLFFNHSVQFSCCISSTRFILFDHYKHAEHKNFIDFQLHQAHRAEAIARIRTNTFFLVLLAVATHLLPVPSLLRAIRAVSSSSDAYDGIYGYLCLLGASPESFCSSLTAEKEVH